jgi:hypothetical protein
VEYTPQAVHERQLVPVGQGDRKAQPLYRVDGHRFIDAPKQLVEARALEPGDVDIPVAGGHGLSRLGIQAIDLIEHMQTGSIVDAELSQDLFYLGIVFGVMSVRYVGHMKNQSCLLYFLEGGAASLSADRE